MPVINSVIKGAGGGGGDEVTAVVQDLDRDTFAEGDKVLLSSSKKQFYSVPDGFNAWSALSSNTLNTSFYAAVLSDNAVLCHTSYIYRTGENSWARRTVDFSSHPEYSCFYGQNSNHDFLCHHLNVTSGAQKLSLMSKSGVLISSKDAMYAGYTNYGNHFRYAQPFGDYFCATSSSAVLHPNIYYTDGASITTLESATITGAGFFFERDGVTYLWGAASGRSPYTTCQLRQLSPTSATLLQNTTGIFPWAGGYFAVYPLVRDGSLVVALETITGLVTVYRIDDILSATPTVVVEPDLTDKIRETLSRLSYSWTRGVPGLYASASGYTSMHGYSLNIRAGTPTEKAKIHIFNDYDYYFTGGTTAKIDFYLTYDVNTNTLEDHGSLFPYSIQQEIISRAGAAGVLFSIPNLRDNSVVIWPVNSSDYLMSINYAVLKFDNATNEPIIAEEPYTRNYANKSLTGIVSKADAGEDYFGHQKIKVKTVLDPANPFTKDQFSEPTGLNLNINDSSAPAIVSVSKGYMYRDGAEYVNVDGVDGATILPQAGDTAREQFTITNNIGIASLPADYTGATNVETIVGSGDQTMTALPDTQGEYAYERLVYLDPTKQAVRYDDVRRNTEFAHYGTHSHSITEFSGVANMHTRAVDKVRVADSLSTSAANYSVLTLPSEYNDLTAVYERVYCVGFVAPEVTGTAYTLPLFTLHDSVNNRDFNVTLSVPTDTANGYTVMVTSSDDTLIGTFVGGDFPPAGVDCCLRLWVRYDGTVTDYIAQLLTNASEHDVTLAGTMTYPMTGDTVSYGYTLTDAERPVFLWHWTGVCANTNPTAISDNINLFNSPTHDIVAEAYHVESGMMTGLCDPYFPKEGFVVSTDSETTDTDIVVGCGRFYKSDGSEIAQPTSQSTSVLDAQTVTQASTTYLQGAALVNNQDGTVSPVLYDGTSDSSETRQATINLTGESSRADLANLYILDDNKQSGHWGEPESNITLVGGSDGEVDTADFTITSLPEHAEDWWSGDSLGWLRYIKDWGGHNSDLGDTKYYSMDVSSAMKHANNSKDVCTAITFVIPSGTITGEGDPTMNKPVTLVNSSTGSETVVVYASESQSGTSSKRKLTIWATITKADNSLLTTPNLVIPLSRYLTRNSWFEGVPLAVTVWINYPETKDASGAFLTTKTGISTTSYTESGSGITQNSAWSDVDAPFALASYDKMYLCKHLPDTAAKLDIATVGASLSVLTEAPESLNTKDANVLTKIESYKISALTNPGVSNWDLGNTIRIPRYSIVGTGATVDSNRNATGFATNNYLDVMSFAPGSNRWAIQVGITTGSDVTTGQTVAGFVNGYGVLPFHIYSGNLQGGLSSDGTSFNLMDVTTIMAVEPNTHYILRCVFTGSYYYWYTVNPETQSLSWLYSKQSSTAVASAGLVLGNYNTMGSPFKGTIHLDECFVQIGNDIVWRPYETVRPKEFKQPVLTANGTMGGKSFAVASSAGDAYKAFDGDSSTYCDYMNAGNWISWYNPQPLKVTGMLVTSSGTTYAPSVGQVQYSDDNQVWVSTSTNWTNKYADPTYLITVDEPIAHKYWRYLVDTKGSATNNNVANIKIEATVVPE